MSQSNYITLALFAVIGLVFIIDFFKKRKEDSLDKSVEKFTSNKNEDKRNYRDSFKKIKKILKFIPRDNLKSTITFLIKKYQKIHINEKNMNYYNNFHQFIK